MFRQRIYQALRMVVLGLAVVMIVLGLAASSLMWGPPALAQVPRRGPCFADAQRLCPDAKMIGERAQCLKSHEAELSPACKARRERVRAQVTAIKEECLGDVERLCKDVPPGGGSIARCLKAHKAELSPACQDALPKGRGRAG
jgi:hypothetical protein